MGIKVSIEYECDNAVFYKGVSDDARVDWSEVTAQLVRVAEQLMNKESELETYCEPQDNPHGGFFQHMIRDANGNTIGSVDVEYEADT